MAEPLLGASGIKLFGQLVDGLTIDLAKAAPRVPGLPARLGQPAPTGAGGEKDAQPASGRKEEKETSAASDGKEATTPPALLARIYGFSYQGSYYDLMRPAIFLVHGEGQPVDDTLAATGVATEPPEFADDLRVWTYDQADFSLRLDMDVGLLERILIEAELGPDRMRVTGQDVRLRQAGQDVRLRQAGQDVRLRYAGQDVRLRGGGGGGASD